MECTIGILFSRSEVGVSGLTVTGESGSNSDVWLKNTSAGQVADDMLRVGPAEHNLLAHFISLYREAQTRTNGTEIFCCVYIRRA